MFTPQQILADKTDTITLEDGGTITIVTDNNNNMIHFKHVNKDGLVIYEWKQN